MHCDLPAFPLAADGIGPFEPSLLRAHRLFESRDLDDTRERISSVMQPHRLRPLARPVRGARSHMDFVRIGGIGMGAIDFGEAMQVEVDEIEDYHLLMFCLRGHAAAVADGLPLQAGGSRGLICGPGRLFHADLSADCEQFVLRLDRRTVEAHAGRPVRFHTELDLRRPALQAWLAQLRLLATSTMLAEAASRNALVAAGLEQLLVQLLMESQPLHDEPPETGRSTAERGPVPGCVHRAEAFMRAHADEPLRLADIAEAAGVPARTLLDGFRRFRAHSPMQYLRAQRLELAHQRLRQPDAPTTVAAVALDCGFLHLGRFAHSYRQRFGQAPSATLAQSA